MKKLRKLDKQIAEVLGYRVTVFDDRNYYLITPNNTAIARVESSAAEGVDEKAVAFCWSRIPYFHADANALLAACVARRLVLHFEDGNNYIATYDGTRFDAAGETPQEAVARALLAALTSEVA